VPMIPDPGGGLFLVVHDKRHREWTFVTGGCHHREVINPIRTAIRELEEETRGAVILRRGTYKYMSFKALDAMYHVFLFQVNIDPRYTIDRFNYEKWKMDTRQVCFRTIYDENDSLKFVTLDELRKCNVWPFITENLLDNPEFHDLLASDSHHNFSIEISNDRKQNRTFGEAQGPRRDLRWLGNQAAVANSGADSQARGPREASEADGPSVPQLGV
jgi:8-oxo-dGTP pyrophosphatase MutT (NUDIX family)